MSHTHLQSSQICSSRSRRRCKNGPSPAWQLLRLQLCDQQGKHVPLLWERPVQSTASHVVPSMDVQDTVAQQLDTSVQDHGQMCPTAGHICTGNPGSCSCLGSGGRQAAKCPCPDHAGNPPALLWKEHLKDLSLLPVPDTPDTPDKGQRPASLLEAGHNLTQPHQIQQKIPKPGQPHHCRCQKAPCSCCSVEKPLTLFLLWLW